MFCFGITSYITALHNIPEGIAIAIPCLAARPESPWLAFGLASLSGLAEPMGASVALLLLRKEDEPKEAQAGYMKNVLAFVAGIMIMVAIRELIPEAQRHSRGGQHAFAAGALTGMLVMLASDYVLEE